MKHRILFITAIIFLTIGAMQASAFDGQRKGFMLNLGIGFGQGALKASAMGTSVTADAMGFATDFKIGAGTSNQFQIYYTNRALWFSPEIGEGENKISGNLYNGMSAAGVTYFLEPQAPSVFFSGALGIGVTNDQDADYPMDGFGFTAGVGFEFTRNFVAELTYMHAGVSGDHDIDGVDTSISNLMIAVSWLAY